MQTINNPPAYNFMGSWLILTIAIVAVCLSACLGEGSGTKPPPTKEIDIENIQPIAVDLCNSVSVDNVCRYSTVDDQLLESEDCTSISTDKPLEGPIYVLEKELGSTSWKSHSYPFDPRADIGNLILFVDVASFVSDVKTVICIMEIKHYSKWNYEDGARAMRLDWEVYAVDWSSGELLTNIEVFEGSSPPHVKSGKEREVFGQPPYSDFQSWLEETFPSSWSLEKNE